MKLYYRKPLFTVLVDKYAVKEYVAKKCGEQYIIPTYGIWNHYDDIDFTDLPDRFVLKCTHDSHSVVICNENHPINHKQNKALFEKALNRNFYFEGRQWPYKNVTPRIIAEEYLENDSSEGLHDYKVWCFNGEPKYIQYITGRMGKDTYEVFYDLNWTAQKFHCRNPLYSREIEKPECLDEMLYLAKVLSSDIPFARVDFYILNKNQIKFGEITFYPFSGYGVWEPKDTDLVLGGMLDLPDKYVSEEA